jgi:hypothetical protein
VFLIGSEGKVKWLFGSGPNAFSSVTNPIAANETVVIPTKPNGTLFLDPVVGTEHLYIVYCQTAWGELEQRLAAADADPRTQPGKAFPPNFGFLDRGTKGTYPATNATVRRYFKNLKWAQAEIASQPLRATNSDVVIERWFRHVAK